MKFLKLGVRKILSLIDPNLEYKMVEQFHFDQLNRKIPDLMWKAIAPGPEPRLDAGRAQVGEELFVIGGFLWGGNIVKFIDIFNFKNEKWIARIPLPVDMPQTHLGIISDGKRYIYSVSGQFGGHCLPASPNCFSFDTHTRSWSKLIPLPKPRYAPVVQLWNRRLHVLEGAGEDRNFPATEHWSIAVENGKPLKNEWREEIPIPHGGHHRASSIINDQFYVFGGQEGDYIAIPGDPQCRCTAELTTEIRFPDIYRLKSDLQKWERMTDMPILSSHTEASIIKFNDSVIILGGDYERTAKKDSIILNDAIQLYNATTDSWKIIGRLPYRLKEAISGYYNNHLYITCGQRDRGPDDPTPLNRFERGTWKVKFSLL